MAILPVLRNVVPPIPYDDGFWHPIPKTTHQPWCVCSLMAACHYDVFVRKFPVPSTGDMSFVKGGKLKLYRIHAGEEPTEKGKLIWAQFHDSELLGNKCFFAMKPSDIACYCVEDELEIEKTELKLDTIRVKQDHVDAILAMQSDEEGLYSVLNRANVVELGSLDSITKPQGHDEWCVCGLLASCKYEVLYRKSPIRRYADLTPDKKFTETGIYRIHVSEHEVVWAELFGVCLEAMEPFAIGRFCVEDELEVVKDVPKFESDVSPMGKEGIDKVLAMQSDEERLQKGYESRGVHELEFVD